MLGPPYLLLFEILAYIQLALCLAHALRRGTPSLVRIAFAAVLGIFLELVLLREPGTLKYGSFFLMIGDVPLCVGLAWGSVLYALIESSEASNLPRWQRPLLDGLLALNVALALDPIATRLGLWDWGLQPHAQFFGVPYAYLLAWFVAVTAFSSVFRMPSHPRAGFGVWLAGPLAALTGLIALIVVNAFMIFVVPSYYRALLSLLVVACDTIYIISLQPRLDQGNVTTLVLWIPLLTLLYTLISGSISGGIFVPPGTVVVVVAMVAVLLALHWPKIRRAFVRKPDFAG
jgi:hypothetical protein